MNLTEILQKNTNYENQEGKPYWGDEDFLTECGVDGYHYIPLAEHGFTYKDIFTWICTDTDVGLRALYLDDKFICYSYQQYRKSDEEFYWVSKEVYDRVSKFVRSLVDVDNYDPKFIDKDFFFNDKGELRITYEGRNTLFHYDEKVISIKSNEQ
jgi:hypothetical protein